MVALVLFVVFAVFGLGWRSWLQHKRTGSTGFKGISGAPGSVEWLAGAGFALASVAAVVAPVLQWTRVLTPVPWLHAPWIQTVGIVAAVVGIAATVYAQLDMGISWRIGVDPNERTELVRTGVFSHVRNPIFTAMLIFGAGVALVTPNVLALAAFVLLLVTIEMQVRTVEEPYLAVAHGDSYQAYTASVGRFLPGLGRTRD